MSKVKDILVTIGKQGRAVSDDAIERLAEQYTKLIEDRSNIKVRDAEARWIAEYLTRTTSAYYVDIWKSAPTQEQQDGKL